MIHGYNPLLSFSCNSTLFVILSLIKKTIRVKFSNDVVAFSKLEDT